MKMLVALVTALSLLLSTAMSLPNPQVSADDVLKTSGSVARYGLSSGTVDQSLIDELFGNGDESLESYKPPQNQRVDSKYKECRNEVYAKQGFQCVPYYQCDDLGEIITDGGEGLIDIRGSFGSSSSVQLDPENSKCPGDLEVCCRHPDFTDAVTAPSTTTTTTRRPKPQKYRSKCGTRNTNGVGVRIQSSGYSPTTQFGEWPHMCALLSQRDEKNLFVCGASLIGEDTVLTAAHCIKDLKAHELKVRCGEWDTQQRVEPKRHEDRTLSSLLIHPSYNPGRLHNDVAVLKVERPFKLDSHIDTICLPDLDSDSESYNPNDCFASGWGKDKFGDSGEYQVILKQVKMDLEHNNTVCEKKLRRTKLGRFFKLDKSFLCAGGSSGIDTCKGDGGGPLMCPRYNRNTNEPQYVQAGITAWGIGCGKNGIPGVYADVKRAMCFIDWASGCMSGRTECPHNKCRDWIKYERLPLQEAYSHSSTKLKYYQGRKSSRGYKRLQRRVRQQKAQLEAFDSVVNQCSIYASPHQFKSAAYSDESCFDDNDDNDDYYDDDISQFQKSNLKAQSDENNSQ